MTCGKIIILNGTSSSGKSMTARTVQQQLEGPVLDAGIDRFIFMLPKKYLNPPHWYEVYEYIWQADGLVIKGGPLGRRLMMGMNHSLAALARDGFTLVVDHVMIEREWLKDCVEALGELEVYFVGIRCPLEVVEQREKDRGDRTLGQAKAQYHVVHQHMIYDLEVDTSLLSPEECAERISQHVFSNPPRALHQLQAKLGVS
jgi:chloramphenicol 3-O phosphotransferase